MNWPVPARWVVLDVEGTVTATAQVHEVLYSYARPRLGPWIDRHQDDPQVAEAVAQVRAEAGLGAEAGTGEVVAVLHGWMDADRKATALKTLQGLIWQHGYASGELRTTLFADVPGALRRFRAQGAGLAVFSSGSAAAQIGLFSSTDHGDLRELFAHHFDTVNAGPKREAAAYRVMSEVLGEQVLFASDVPAELDAAAQAGWATVGLARPGEPWADADFGEHPTTTTFDDVRIEVPA